MHVQWIVGHAGGNVKRATDGRDQHEFAALPSSPFCGCLGIDQFLFLRQREAHRACLVFRNLGCRVERVNRQPIGHGRFGSIAVQSVVSYMPHFRLSGKRT
jgi:hypothetical protein